jgi:hypothetical protein
VIQSYSSHASEFKSEDKVSFDDEAGMRAEKKVAMKMLADCPAIILEMGRRSVDEDDVSEVERDSLKEDYRDQNRTVPFLAKKE